MRKNRYIDALAAENDKIKEGLARLEKIQPKKKTCKSIRRPSTTLFHTEEHGEGASLLCSVQRELARATAVPPTKQEKLSIEREAYQKDKEGKSGDSFQQFVNDTIARLYQQESMAEVEICFVLWGDYPVADFHSGNEQFDALLSYITEITRKLSGPEE